MSYDFIAGLCIIFITPLGYMNHFSVFYTHMRDLVIFFSVFYFNSFEDFFFFAFVFYGLDVENGRLINIFFMLK